jgi:5-methylcytosine-specific restriction endonuclease McrA
MTTVREAEACDRVIPGTSVSRVMRWDARCAHEVCRFRLRELTRDRLAECWMCGSPEAPELEHIVSLSRGGLACIENTAMACRACNAWKGERTVEELYDLGTQSPERTRGVP